MTLAPADLERWVQSNERSPQWLRARRTAAARAFAVAPMPTERDEDFRYGRIDALDLAAYSPSPEPARLSGAPGEALLAALGEVAAVVTTLDGRVVSGGPATPDVPGLVIGSLSARAEPPSGYGTLLADVDESIALLADALALDAVVIEAAPGAAIAHPVVVVHATSGIAGQAIAPRTMVRAGSGAELSVIELFVSGDAELLVVPVTELHVERAAHLAYHALQELGGASWQLGYQLSRVERDGSLRSFSAALGGAYARLYTRSSLVEEGAEGRLLATYLASGAQVQDLRTFQEHEAPRTTSELVFKGAVADTARSVYTGLIHIAKGARRANAAQTNRNLVLSEGAHADSVPNLDIEENDVRCSHASAVGPIDRDQRFYLESRGVPSEVAERLILLGFFDDLLDDVPEPGCGRYLRKLIGDRLAAVRP